MFRYAFVIVGFLSIVSSFEAVAASRVALVIGNESYTSLSPLSNPALDATAIARVLGDHGFEVKLYKNLDYREFEKAVADFVAFSQGAEEAVVFYAGHGMSVVEDGRIINVLAATDAVMDCRTRSAQKVVGLEEILTKLAHVPKKVALFDACRSDPLPQCFGFGFQAPKLSGNNGDVGSTALNVQSTRGPVVESTDTQSQLLIGYSSNLGETARDGEPGQHSPYAKALLAELDLNPKTPFRELLDKTATRVTSLTGSQFPWVVTKGGEPQMCLAGEGCQTSNVLKDDQIMELSRRVAKLSEDALSRGDVDSAIAFALEGLPDPTSELLSLRDRPYSLEAYAALESAMRAGTRQRTLSGHQSEILFLSYSKDGKRLVSSGYDPFAILWDTVQGREIARLETTGDPYVLHSLSPNGKLVATLGADITNYTHNGKVVRVWNAKDGKMIFQIHPKGERELLGFLDDKHVLSSDRKGVSVWKVETGERVSTIPTRVSGYIRAYPYGAHKRLALLASYSGLGGNDLGQSTLELWDLEKRKRLKRFSAHKGGVDSAVLSPDGSLLLTGSEDKTVTVWDLNSNKRKFSISTPAMVRSVAFSPNGDRIAAVTDDGRVNGGDVLIWRIDSPSKPILHKQAALFRGGRSVEFTATGDSVVATSFSAKGLIFDANTGLITRRFRSPSLLLRIDGAISTAAANPVTEQIATGGDRGEITLWEKEGDVIYSGAENTPTVEHLSSLGFVHRDGGQAGPHPIFPSFGSLKFEITDDGRGTIRVTDVPTGTVFLNLKHQLENVHEFALDREQNMLVARGGTGHEWDPRKPRTFSYQQWPFVRPLAELVPLAQKRALRCLAPENRVAAELPQDPPAWCVSLNKPPYATVGNKRN